MHTIRASEFLLEIPNPRIDHAYLTQLEIDALPLGIYYKKKSRLTRHRFIKAQISANDSSVTFEAVDYKGYWRIETEEIEVIQDWLIKHTNHRPASDSEVLTACGLTDFVDLMDAPLPAGRSVLPTTLAEMAVFYENYTDMDLQGHFDPDSPDLERLNLILSWIPAGKNVLDVGCNSGAFGAALIEKDCAVSGIDISSNLVEVARAKGVKAVHGFAEDLPFLKASFDVAICAELLEHVLEPWTVLREIARVLRPGGLLVGSVPHGAGDWGHSDIGHHEEHLRSFDILELEELLESEGFMNIVSVEQFHGNDIAQGLAFKCLLAQ